MSPVGRQEVARQGLPRDQSLYVFFTSSPAPGQPLFQLSAAQQTQDTGLACIAQKT